MCAAQRALIGFSSRPPPLTIGNPWLYLMFQSVDSPTIPLDGKEMFYHKKVGGNFVIYRAERNANGH